MNPTRCLTRPLTPAALLLTIFTFNLVFTHQARFDNPAFASLPTLQGTAAAEHLQKQGLHHSLGEAMAAARYRIWPVVVEADRRTGAQFSAGNPQQRYHSYFSPDGLRMKAKTCDEQHAEFGLALKSVGYAGRQERVTPGTLTASGDRIEIARQVENNSALSTQHSALIEWYLNRPEGIEQGFTLASAPGARQGDEPLRLTMTVTGELRAELSADGEAALLKNASGGVMLRYHGLKVWDANGRQLAAQMRVNASELTLEVDDRQATYPVTIDPVIDTQIMKIEAFDKGDFDLFGSSVAISGDTVIVGAPLEDDPGNNSGAAYIFERNRDGANMWGEVKKLEASDKEAGDNFGISVAISGSTAIVGAPLEDDPGADSGAAYIFSRNQGGADNWGEVKKVEASDKEAGDNFGFSVAISNDTVIVGARQEDDPGSESGAAYIFSRNQGGADNWGEVKKIEASDKQAGDRFGWSVGVSNDTVIVGAPHPVEPSSDAGTAYIFERNRGGENMWGEVKKLEAFDKEAGDNFGFSVAISGSTAIVGAPYEDDPGSEAGAAYIFERNWFGADNWGEVQTLKASDKQEGDQFGYSVAISSDAAIVGARWEDDPGINSGAAYIFERNVGGREEWGEARKLEASDKQEGDSFGVGVGISGDTAIVGAPGEDDPGTESGAAYIFSTTCAEWKEVARTEALDHQDKDLFGNAVAISGDTAIVGAPGEDDPGTDSGAAYIFERNRNGGDLWGQVMKIESEDLQADDNFGAAVGISGDTAIVGAFLEDDSGNSAGAAYIFERNKNGEDMWGQVIKLSPTYGTFPAGAIFGVTVAISGDTAVVGATNEDRARVDDTSGAAYVFERNRGGADKWGQVKRLVPGDLGDADQFAHSVAISGDTIVIGSIGDDDSAMDSGAAYIFGRNQGGPDNWGEVRKLKPDTPIARDVMGWGVAISGDTVAAGAPRNGTGAIYIFERNKNGAEMWGQVRKLTPVSEDSVDTLGENVAISGDTVVAGTQFEQDPGLLSGAAFIFERNKNGAEMWGQVKKLESLGIEAGDKFGISVGISGNTIIVGAQGVNGEGTNFGFDYGAAHIFSYKCDSPPTIEVNAVTRTAGSPGANAQIATVADVGDLTNTLRIEISSDGNSFNDSATLNGVTVTLTDQNPNSLKVNPNEVGAVFADVVADCEATGATFKLRVEDSAGQTTTKDFSVTVNPNTPPTLSYTSQNFILGATPMFMPATGPSDNGSISSIEVQSITPNTGLSLTVDNLTGKVSVTSSTDPGNYEVVIRAKDNCSEVSEIYTDAKFTITIECAMITLSSLPNGTASVFYDQTVTASPAGSYTFARTGTLPPGLTFNTATGRLSGTPTTAGTYNFTITATAFGECSGMQSYSLVIDCPMITLSSLPNGTASIFYDQTVTASPSGGSYTFIQTGTVPPGLFFNPTTRRLSGTPTKAGSYTFTIKATGFGTCMQSQEYTVTIACPTITLSSLANGTAGTPYDQTVTASPAGGSYSFQHTSGTLPPGLTFNPTTGRLQGTPTLAGMFSFTIMATGFGTCTQSQPYTVTIACPTIVPSALPGGVAGTFYNQTMTASPAGGNYSFQHTSGTLPPGLTFNPTTAQLSGTPTTAGTYNFTITATGFGECTGPRTYALVIACPTITLSPSGLPAPVLYTPYTQALSAAPAGTTYTYLVSSGSLPMGMTLSGDGTLSGTPTQKGTFNFTVRATGFGACIGSRSYTLIVQCPTIAVGPASLSGGTVGSSYSQSVSASPMGTYTYSVSSGTLPAGLTLNSSTGVITGMPTASGTFNFVIAAAAGGCTGSRSYTVMIACPTFTVSPGSLTAVEAGNPYTQPIVVSPAGAYSFSLTAGNLPNGLTLHALSGVISGTPTMTGTYNFTVKAQSTGGCSTTKSYTLVIKCPALVLNPATLSNGTRGASYSQTLSSLPSGGNYNFSVTGGALPPGLTLNAVTGVLSGTPTTAGTFSFTVKAAGFGSCSNSRDYTVVIGSSGS